MTNPRQLLDDYAAEETSCCGRWACGTTPREDLAEKAFGALRAVLDRHKPQAELVWPDPGETETKERHVCVECSGWGPYVDWPCQTVRDIASALKSSP